MATYHEAPKPERFRGTPEENWKQLFAYLWKLAEWLDIVINNISAEGESNSGTVRNKKTNGR